MSKPRKVLNMRPVIKEEYERYNEVMFYINYKKCLLFFKGLSIRNKPEDAVISFFHNTLLGGSRDFERLRNIIRSIVIWSKPDLREMVEVINRYSTKPTLAVKSLMSNPRYYQILNKAHIGWQQNYRGDTAGVNYQKLYNPEDIAMILEVNRQLTKFLKSAFNIFDIMEINDEDFAVGVYNRENDNESEDESDPQ